MESKDIILLAVTLLILGEVTFLLAKLPKNNIKTKDRAILVDTSVLMDGRIIAVAGTGFIGGTLVIPRSVIGELQFLADHADADKRARARHGLDVVTELQAMERVDVELLQDGSHAREGVDDRLLKLAKQHSAIIMTLDYNLNKVAAVEGTEVLNLNELAQSLRMDYLPGEKLMLELIQKGQDGHQAVGYLPDGTMVVVEQASAKIGQTHTVEIVRSLQTAAGRMMFAKLADVAAASQEKIEKRRISSNVQKSRGRAPVNSSAKISSKTTKTENLQMKKQSSNSRNTKQEPTQKPKTTRQNANRQTKSRRRPDHEADLISLVNDQP